MCSPGCVKPPCWCCLGSAPPPGAKRGWAWCCWKRRPQGCRSSDLEWAGFRNALSKARRGFWSQSATQMPLPKGWESCSRIASSGVKWARQGARSSSVDSTLSGKPKRSRASMTPCWARRGGEMPGGDMKLPRSRNAVVVAHPDDEALWLSAVVASVERVVFSFGAAFDKPQRSEARRQAVAALPLSGIVNLGIPESGAGWKAYQTQPQLTPSGVEISDATLRERYEANYAKLLEGLRASLAGCRDVYTHNPWGEYGHSEHIQVYRAVTALQDELGYTVWFSNYVGARNWTFVRGLAERLSWARRTVVKPDLVTARALMRVYRRYGAWTWTLAHRWPAHEVLYAQPPGSSPDLRYLFSGERLLDVERLRWWPPPWRSPWRLLGHPHEPRGRALLF